jgi:hypothetical protein
MNADDKEPINGKEKENNEENKPAKVMFSNTIINPGTMVIILRYTSFTYVTVIGSAGFVLDAVKTNGLSLFVR